MILRQTLTVEITWDTEEEAPPEEWIGELEGVSILSKGPLELAEGDPLPNNVYFLHLTTPPMA